MASIESQRLNKWLVLLVFLGVVMGVGAFIGTQTAPGDWYAALSKPSLNPPNWIFAPVWFVLYVFIAIAGWRTWSRDSTSLAFNIWGAQLVLNWVWSPVFFTMQWLWPALAVIATILGLIAMFIVLAWRKDRLSSVLFIPYFVWVSFATYLNGAIAVLNS